MSTVTITLHCPHPMEDETPCESEIEVECEVEPADPSYGADADGNRGMYVGAYVQWDEDWIPPACPEGHTFTDEERKELAKDLESKANDYDLSPPEPEYDEDDMRDMRERYGR